MGLLDYSMPDTVEQPLLLATETCEQAIAFLRDEKNPTDFVLLTPKSAKMMVDNGVHVFMQHGFAEGSQFSDMDYADAGVEFVDDFYQLAQMVRTLVKYKPFSQDQIELCRQEQILISTQDFNQVTLPFVQQMTAKKISAISLNLLKDKDGDFILEKTLNESQSPLIRSSALSNFLAPMLMAFVCSPRLRFALQRISPLMNATYCFEGHVCHKELADKLKVPFKDVVSLCWDLN